MPYTDSPLFTSHAPLLRAIAERLGLPPLAAVARAPGINGALRVTVHYADRRSRDSVATLTRTTARAGRTSSESGVLLDVVYDRALNQRHLQYALPIERYEVVMRALQAIGFDRMADQPDLPTYDTVDLWLVQRAAGTFFHDVIAAPALVAPTAFGEPYARLVNAIRNGLAEAVREIPSSS
jgi:hypothetical protein